MKTPDPREAKLPVWAKNDIADLRRELAEVTERFSDYADSVLYEDIVVVTKPYAKHPKPVTTEGSDVRFYLDGYDGHRWIDVRTEDGGVRVMASTGLRIVPSVTNVLHLSLTRDS